MQLTTQHFNHVRLFRSRSYDCLIVWLAAIMILLLLSPAPASAMDTGVLVSMTNQKRLEQGLAPLINDSALAASAQAKALDMFEKDYWSHVSPVGVEPWHFIKQSHYPYIAAGENLAKDFPTEAAVVDGWMNSPTHRQNLLSPSYKDIGIAAQTGQLLGSSTVLVVAHYGAKAAAPEVLSNPTQNEQIPAALSPAAAPPAINKPAIVPPAVQQLKTLPRATLLKMSHEVVLINAMAGLMNASAGMHGLYLGLFPKAQQVNRLGRRQTLKNQLLRQAHLSLV